ncbi:IS6 family transposase (plasmid) [Pseudochrobactrum algeriensis]|uniref:IS6 family transposase n=1 Tax=Pseudochrobactrum algeriensis TaxID=2834768 RepID=UPI001BD04229|nr:IS6 family transposase [Pseudochrobactrum algeriensis]QVQ38661.1 IS6 family transposase [Pseudochrobactrum algeriensis]QVQ42225.1 IS6 family transposase [Pseudochrobactrum algeriensis]QVQ45741.1 IS6 family transposase [Pseudochrobactrum algeriensis]
MVDFKGTHFPKSVILYAVFFYVRYSVSYRDLQEIMAERGVEIDHATLNRWVVKYSPQIATHAQKRKRATLGSWRVDETYIKVKGKWTYLYRAVDRDGQTLDFMLSERRNLSAARRFLKKAIASNSVPNKIVIDKSGANLAGAQAINNILKITDTDKLIEILQVKYLNNILEQDHRFIKRVTKHMLGFKAFHSASATIAGIEVAHMIRKNQFANDNRSPFVVFAELAA